jgi:hypothetical protein
MSGRSRPAVYFAASATSLRDFLIGCRHGTADANGSDNLATFEDQNSALYGVIGWTAPLAGP